MNYNFHTHTHFCHHASGTEEEYVFNAIEHNLEHLGFSDHVPLRFPDGEESAFRVLVDEASAYCGVVNALREKYRDRIRIEVGFEMEYYPEYFEGTLENVRRWGGEYLILGQHFVLPENTGAKYLGKHTGDEEELEKYVDAVIEGMGKKVFSYVAHPDIFFFAGEESVYEKKMRRLAAASRELSTPLEINFLGIRGHRRYPNPLFWRIVGEERAPVTFGFDAHKPEAVFDAVSLLTAREMVEEFGLYYIGKPDLIRL